MSERAPFFGTDREFADLRGPLLAAVEEVLASGRALQGPAVARLEGRLAAWVGRAHAVAVNSCTDALSFALVAARIGPGDEVIVPDFSFVSTVSSVLRVGATPVLVDVDASFGLDLALAERAVSERTRAVVYVHLYGAMGDPAAIEAFADRHGLVLVEDAAQAVGARIRGRAAGSVGRASCFSFDPTKVLSAPGSGGMLLTDDDELAAVVRQLRLHGHAGGEFFRVGHNSQLSTLAAAALEVKLGHEERWLRRRREIAAAYVEALAGTDVRTPEPGGDREHVFHKFVVRTPERDALAAALERAGVATRVHYPYRLHDLAFMREHHHRVVESGQAARAVREVLSLPIHPYLTDDEVERVVGAFAPQAMRS